MFIGNHTTIYHNQCFSASYHIIRLTQQEPTHPNYFHTLKKHKQTKHNTTQKTSCSSPLRMHLILSPFHTGSHKVFTDVIEEYLGSIVPKEDILVLSLVCDVFDVYPFDFTFYFSFYMA